jgi:hypothetical protein
MFKMAKATAESRDDAIQLIIETEFPSVLIEDVRYLLCKVQKGLSWEDAIDALITWGQPVEAEERSELAAACERLREVEKLSKDALQEAVRANKLKLETEEKARLQLEDQKLFHAPAMAADFEHYRLHEYWDMHEATCLLLGKDPRRLKQTFLLNSPGRSPFAAQFRELTGMLTHTAEVKLVGNKRRIEPSRLVPWALTIGIHVPEALAVAYSRPDTEPRQGLGHEVQPSPAAPTGTAKSQSELEKALHDLKNQLRSEKAANSRWRNTTLAIIYGLLHGNFRGTPQEKPASVNKVTDFIEEVLGRRIDANTIRSRRKEIEEIIPELQAYVDQEQAAKKRNS